MRAIMLLALLFVAVGASAESLIVENSRASAGSLNCDLCEKLDQIMAIKDDPKAWRAATVLLAHTPYLSKEAAVRNQELRKIDDLAARLLLQDDDGELAEQLSMLEGLYPKDFAAQLKNLNSEDRKRITGAIKEIDSAVNPRFADKKPAASPTPKTH